MLASPVPSMVSSITMGSIHTSVPVGSATTSVRGTPSQVNNVRETKKPRA